MKIAKKKAARNSSWLSGKESICDGVHRTGCNILGNKLQPGSFGAMPLWLGYNPEPGKNDQIWIHCNLRLIELNTYTHILTHTHKNSCGETLNWAKQNRQDLSASHDFRSRVKPDKVRELLATLFVIIWEICWIPAEGFLVNRLCGNDPAIDDVWALNMSQTSLPNSD